MRISVVILLAALVAACTEESMRPQPVQPEPQPVTGGAESQPSKDKPELNPVIKHNLSRVAVANPVTPEQLAALEVGKTRQEEVIRLLGDIKPFTLRDGKQIYRYDVGKFIFGPDGVLIRKFLNH